jgi:hypothetical protein
MFDSADFEAYTDLDFPETDPLFEGAVDVDYTLWTGPREVE